MAGLQTPFYLIDTSALRRNMEKVAQLREASGARALLALGRLDEAERHAQDAVRLDPEEVRYRELLAQVLSAGGAHRDAAA